MITVDNQQPIVAFINTTSNTKDTPVAEYNQAVLDVIKAINAKEIAITAFTGKDGKIVMGFKQPITIHLNLEES